MPWRERLDGLKQLPVVQRLAKQALTGISTLTKPVGRIARSVANASLRLEFQRDWAFTPNPEWFDHELDVALFAEHRRPHFFERGVYASEICGGKRVLDLCCGDGSVAALFLGKLAESVLAVDFDSSAIRHATHRWAALSSVRFEAQDIRDLKVSAGAFDVVTWDAAIEHFTQAEMAAIMAGIQRALVPGGILHGSTVQKTESWQHHEHEYEFETAAELHTFLLQFFPHVAVWERVHEDRFSLYFRCSRVPLPEFVRRS